MPSTDEPKAHTFSPTTTTPAAVMTVFGIAASAAEVDHPFSSPVSLSAANIGKSAEVPLPNRCFCNYGPSVCETEGICVKHALAACFHAVVHEYSSKTGSIERQHFFGCAPLEKGSDASHLTCNAWRAVQSNPRSVACCYEGNFCNRNLTVPDFPAVDPTGHLGVFPLRHHGPSAFAVPSLTPFAFLLFGFFVGVCLLATFVVPFRCWLYKRKGKQSVGGGELPSAQTSQSQGIAFSSSSDSATALLKQFQKQQLHSQQQPGFELSCSASVDGLTLVQRSIALDLQLMEVFARGRYGELRKAMYRGTMVAVKIFYTTEEESWLNERDIYQSQMVNHENILQFVAADILSSVESLTQMLLITDFHPLGSLYDFLCADVSISLEEALQLALSTISGLEHLHNALRGTAGRTKPAIAHRDIKSKNVLVKRRGVCCVADFGLAVRLEDGRIIPRHVNIGVGTKRYMAPELLLGTLNVHNFEEFKGADIYSFALVLWEILNRIEVSDRCSSFAPQPSPPPASSVSLPFPPSAFPIYASGNGFPQRTFIGRSSGSSSGFASSGCSTDRTLATFANSLPTHQRHHFEAKTELKRRKDAGGGSQSTDGERNDTQRRQQKEHSLPFKGVVGNDPSIEQMRQIVCVQKLRPPLEAKWRDSANHVMHSLHVLLTECWSERWQSRHTALKLKTAMTALLDERRNTRGTDG